MTTRRSTVLRAAVDKNPTYSLAWYDLAFGLRARGQHAAAVDAYEHYIKLKPGDPDPYYGLGRSLQHLGRTADARRAFETYLSLEKRPSEQRWVESAEAQIRTLTRREVAPDAGASQRQVEREGRAVARLAVDRQRPAVRDRDLPADVEAEAEPADAACGRDAFERMEDPGLIGARDPRACVLDVEAQAARRRVRAESRIGLPAPYLIAFESRLVTICSTRMRSQRPTIGSGIDDLDARTGLRRLFAQPARDVADQIDQLNGLDVQREPSRRQARRRRADRRRG